MTRVVERITAQRDNETPSSRTRAARGEDVSAGGGLVLGKRAASDAGRDDVGSPAAASERAETDADNCWNPTASGSAGGGRQVADRRVRDQGQSEGISRDGPAEAGHV